MKTKFVVNLHIAAVFLLCLVPDASGAEKNSEKVIVDKKGVEKVDEFFSRDVEKNTPEVKPTTTIDIKNGEEIVLRASIVKEKINGQFVKRLAYNGMIPGPMLRVKQGSQIKVKLFNDTDVETSLHSHGLRLSTQNDGMPGISQPPTLPGQSFTYNLVFPDSGYFWYHPHLREDYAQEMGLYGTIRVLPNSDTYHNKVDQEVPLILDDLNLDSNGRMPKFFKDRTNYALMGRFGNHYLVNNEKMFTWNIRAGEVVRFLVINVANTRTFRLTIPGLKMKRIAGDLSLYEKEEFIEELILSPSERTIIEVSFDIKGTYSFMHRGGGKAIPIAKVNVSQPEKNMEYVKVEKFEKLRDSKEVASEMKEVRNLASKKPDYAISLQVTLSDRLKKSMSGMNHHTESSQIEWEDPMESMNYASSSKDVTWELFEKSTGKKNMEINWRFKRGELKKILITNESHSDHPMHHPIHFHGQRFAVLKQNGVVNQNMAWKDSAIVHAGETIEVVLDPSNPGKWMTHCHIAEHLHSGMMLGFQVD